ncbi:HD domain-containing protein [Candidatus Kaiserbacteria bacterium]|nr:HD domain-containing protein [Candidatus Kaiserbacteria bacterium]
MRLKIPNEVLHVYESLHIAGYEAYLIGGCVRDLLLEREPKDWDITTNATPEKIQQVFPDSFYENQFGTVGVKTESEDPRLKVIEVTPYRLEDEYKDARWPNRVVWSDKLEDDLKRRDFTINAIAYEPHRSELIDLHEGEEALKNKLVVAVGDPKERFAEDALRMLRAVRLACELDFTIASETMAGIAANASQLEKISCERIRDEFIRIIETDRPMQGLYVAQKLGLLKYILPELEGAMGIEQNQAHSFDVFEHSLRTLQYAADQKWPIHVRLAALLHDIGKPDSRRHDKEKDDFTFHGHEVIGARMAKKILENLKLPNDLTEKIVRLVRWHMFFSDPDKITLSAVRRLIVNVGQENIWDLLNLRICDRIGTGRPKAQPFRLRKYISMVEEALRDPISVGMLKIDGKQLMALSAERPGPKIGWTLHALLEEVFDDPTKNDAAYLERHALELLALPAEELKKLGEQGKDRRTEEDEKEVEKLREKYHVS